MLHRVLAVLASLFTLTIVPLVTTPADPTFSAFSTVPTFATVPTAHAETLNEGHIDAFYVTSDLSLQLKNDSGLHDPAEITLAVPASAYREETAAYLGVGAYFLPQAQQQGLIWPGWDTTESGTALRLVFRQVEGPGSVYLFSQGTFGGVEPLLAGDSLELTSGAEILQDHPAHVHANWAFTAPGTYTMTVQAVAYDGRESAPATYTWVVGDGSSDGAPGGVDKPYENPTGTPAAGAPTPAGGEAGASSPAHTTTAATGTAARNENQLAETGPTQYTGPLALLGLGLAVLGGSVIFAARRP